MGAGQRGALDVIGHGRPVRAGRGRALTGALQHAGLGTDTARRLRRGPGGGARVRGEGAPQPRVGARHGRGVDHKTERGCVEVERCAGREGSPRYSRMARTPSAAVRYASTRRMPPQRAQAKTSNAFRLAQQPGPIQSRRALLLRFHLHYCPRHWARFLWLRLCPRLGEQLHVTPVPVGVHGHEDACNDLPKLRRTQPFNNDRICRRRSRACPRPAARARRGGVP